MQLLINGHTLTVPAEVQNIAELLAHLQLNAELAIVELNAIILQAEARDSTILTDGDRIEIVQFVGGG